MGGRLLFDFRSLYIKKVILFLLLLSTAALSAVWPASWRDANLHLIFCDVGQGDAILATYRTTQILIDGGPGEKVLSCLSEHLPFWDRQIEMIVLSHPQTDHLAGLIDVIKRYNVTQFVVNSVSVDSAGFGEFFNAVLAENVPVYSPQLGDKIKIGPVYLSVLWPQQKLGDEEMWLAKDSTERSSVLGTVVFKGETNETSIVARLSFGNFDALLTGDIGFDTEEKLVLPASGQIEVLKVAHHGSKYSTGEEFLARLKPALAIISVGKNSYGHPTEEVIERLGYFDTRILRTDEAGEIEVVSDGKNWYIKGR